MQLSHTLHSLCKWSGHESYNDDVREAINLYEGFDEDDFNTGPRLPMHVLAIAPHGELKSWALSNYMDYMIGGVKYGEAVDMQIKRGLELTPPTYTTLTGKGTSWERLQGSINNSGEVVLPIILDCDYLLLPEMFSFLGSDKRVQRNKCNKLNEVLEERSMTNNQVQIAGLDLDEDELESYRQKGLHINPEKGTWHFNAECTVWSATRPLDQGESQRLRDLGYLDRYNIAHWKGPSNELRGAMDFERELEEDWQGRRELYEFNMHKLWGTSCKNIKKPPRHDCQNAARKANKYADGFETVTGVPTRDTRTHRYKAAVYQLLTACAWERTVMEHGEEGALTVDELEYKNTDVAQARFFVYQFVQDRIYRAKRNVNMEKVGDDGLHFRKVLEYKHPKALDTASANAFPDNRTVRTSDFVEYFEDKLSRSPSRGRQFAMKCRKRGWVDHVESSEGKKLMGRHQVTEKGKSVLHISTLSDEDGVRGADVDEE
jgi:hypothetical protein